MNRKPREDAGDDYRTVTTKLRGIREKSIFVDAPASRGGKISLPRSLLHGADDLALEKRFAGEEVTFRIRAWKAEEAGWA